MPQSPSAPARSRRQRRLRTVVPFTDIHPLAERALKRFAPAAERIKTARCDLPRDCGARGCAIQIRHCHHDQSCSLVYSELLRDLWSRGDDLLIIEHDIEIHAGLVEEARSCPQLWCTWPYNGPGWTDPNSDPLLYESLGCSRFSSKLMRAEPDLLAVASALSQGLPAGDWRRLDASILPTLPERGYTAHRHFPPVLHHHRYEPEGCACGGKHE